MLMEIPKIQIATAKVMRSHDYCHFEISLTSSEANTPEQIDDLRKTAARLADKAVEQYKVAKAAIERRISDGYCLPQLARDAAEAEKVAEVDRTPEQKATIKAFDDANFRARHPYNYEDDWREHGDDDVSF